MKVFFKELSLDVGFEYAKIPREARIIAGFETSLASGIKLFESLQGSPIVCWSCGCVADRWIVGRGRKENGKPVMNLYGSNKHGRILMMTRDHIIPKSLGGADAVANLRPACEDCNGRRGNKVGKDLEFMFANPQLVIPERINLEELKKCPENVREFLLGVKYNPLQFSQH